MTDSSASEFTEIRGGHAGLRIARGACLKSTASIVRIVLHHGRGSVIPTWVAQVVADSDQAGSGRDPAHCWKQVAVAEPGQRSIRGRHGAFACCCRHDDVKTLDQRTQSLGLTGAQVFMHGLGAAADLAGRQGNAAAGQSERHAARSCWQTLRRAGPRDGYGSDESADEAGEAAFMPSWLSLSALACSSSFEELAPDPHSSGPTPSTASLRARRLNAERICPKRRRQLMRMMGKGGIAMHAGRARNATRNRDVEYPISGRTAIFST